MARIGAPTYIADEAAYEAAAEALFAAHSSIMPEATNAIVVSDFGGMISTYVRKDVRADDVMYLTYQLYDLWRERVVQEGLLPEHLPTSIAGMTNFDRERYLKAKA